MKFSLLLVISSCNKTMVEMWRWSRVENLSHLNNWIVNSSLNSSIVWEIFWTRIAHNTAISSINQLLLRVISWRRWRFASEIMQLILINVKVLLILAPIDYRSVVGFWRVLLLLRLVDLADFDIELIGSTHRFLRAAAKIDTKILRCHQL